MVHIEIVIKVAEFDAFATTLIVYLLLFIVIVGCCCWYLVGLVVSGSNVLVAEHCMLLSIVIIVSFKHLNFGFMLIFWSDLALNIWILLI